MQPNRQVNELLFGIIRLGENRLIRVLVDAFILVPAATGHDNQEENPTKVFAEIHARIKWPTPGRVGHGPN